MFYISHGTLKLTENVEYFFDAKNYSYVVNTHKNIHKHSLIDKEWLENSCHPNGLFFCPRCYRKHNVVDNFDLLCDGCTILLKDYHSYGLSFEFTERFNQWYTNVPTDVVNARLSLRMELYKVHTSEFVFHEERPLTILRDPLKNNGDLEVCYSDLDITDKKNRFILNIKEMSYGSKG